MRDRVLCKADAGSDERRYAPPRTEIRVSVGQDQPLGFAAGIGIHTSRGYAAIAEDEPVCRVEVGLAAILPDHVGPEPVVEPVAHTDAEDTCGIKTIVLLQRQQAG